ncbi:hypothetical protein FGO68_gene2605 [Halteria grandinella]|uniref:Uncharacterized protein n=1 Tax=Halteria grandinella TaxID=5974 RepID=A0A8J8NTU9_HALGN|nr:hypothetical protein FGO68_gene2605 [Halteria grandinella]
MIDDSISCLEQTTQLPCFFIDVVLQLCQKMINDIIVPTSHTLIIQFNTVFVDFLVLIETVSSYFEGEQTLDLMFNSK